MKEEEKEYVQFLDKNGTWSKPIPIVETRQVPWIGTPVDKYENLVFASAHDSIDPLNVCKDCQKKRKKRKLT